MYKLTDDLKERFRSYVTAAEGSAADLEFLLDNLDVHAEVRCTIECFEYLESLFWRVESGEVELPKNLMTPDEFIALICRFLGQCMVGSFGARWVQSVEKNRLFAQPCVDGFGNREWDRFYPVQLAQNFRDLAHSNPTFPGVRDRRVLARQFEKAAELFRRNKTSAIGQ